MTRPGRCPKSSSELAVMRRAGRIVHRGLEMAREMARPGVRTREINDAIARHVVESGAFSSFDGYPNPHPGPEFQGVICVSINDEVVHGQPGPRKLQSGDILSVDFAVYLVGSFNERGEWVDVQGADLESLRRRRPGSASMHSYIRRHPVYASLHADAAVTVGVGRISRPAERLLHVTQECLAAAIEKISPAARLSDLARAVQGRAEEAGYSVVRQFVGHGIGYSMHEPPQVPNFVDHSVFRKDVRLVAGEVLAIEPMINEGTHRVRELADRWTVATEDGKLSAHFEHSVAVTAAGGQVLTAA